MSPEDKEKAIKLLYTYKRYYQDFEAYAKLTEPVEMYVWQGEQSSSAGVKDSWQDHGAKPENLIHTAPVGTRVRIWMVSRFGDAGVTDSPNPVGYDARVSWDTLDDIEIVKVEPEEPTEETRRMVDRMLGKPKKDG